MKKKNFWIAVGGGFVAGVVACLLICSLCKEQIFDQNFKSNPVEARMMQPHKKGHMDMENKHHHRHHGFHHQKPKDGINVQKQDFDQAYSIEERRHHHRPTPEMKEHFAKKLGLTDEQKVKLEQMREEDMAKMEPLIKQREEIRVKMRELRKINREHFESVLTDEQKEILQQMKEKWKK